MAFMIRSFKSELQLPPSHRVRILNLEIAPKLCTRVYPGTTRRVVVVAETNHPFVNESQLREIAHTHLLYENEKLSSAFSYCIYRRGLTKMCLCH